MSPELAGGIGVMLGMIIAYVLWILAEKWWT